MSTTRGEVTVTGQDGQIYTLKLGIAACCELEEAFNGRSVLSLFDDLTKGGVKMTTLREIVKAAMSQKTNEDAYKVIENVGINPMIEGITRSLLAIHDASLTNGDGKASPPRRAKKAARVGADSSKTSANLASSGSA